MLMNALKEIPEGLLKFRKSKLQSSLVVGYIINHTLFLVYWILFLTDIYYQSFIALLVSIFFWQATGEAGKNNHLVGSNSYETDRSCELEFGSYCLWSREHREVIQDSLVKKLKDQLFEARAYYPSIAKLKGQESLTQEVKLNIQDHERMLSDAVSDYDLQPL